MFLYAFLIMSLYLSHALGYSEDNYYPENGENPYMYSEDPEDNDLEIYKKNNNHFLRFGRSQKKFDLDYDDYVEDFARPTRSGSTEKNDHFIRFGRTKQDFLRFGRSQHRVARDRSNYLRFGRSIPTGEQNKKRSKRDTYSEEIKRGGSNFVRFGRNSNSNFMRFGRDQPSLLTIPTSESGDQSQIASLANKMKQVQDSPLLHLLTELIANVRQQNKNCIRVQ